MFGASVQRFPVRRSSCGPQAAKRSRSARCAVRFLVEANDSHGSVTVFECDVPADTLDARAATAMTASRRRSTGSRASRRGPSTATSSIDPEVLAASRAASCTALHPTAAASMPPFLAIATPGVFGPAYFREIGDAPGNGGAPPRTSAVIYPLLHAPVTACTPAAPSGALSDLRRSMAHPVAHRPNGRDAGVASAGLELGPTAATAPPGPAWSPRVDEDLARAGPRRRRALRQPRPRAPSGPVEPPRPMSASMEPTCTAVTRVPCSIRFWRSELVAIPQGRLGARPESMLISAPPPFGAPGRARRVGHRERPEVVDLHLPDAGRPRCRASECGCRSSRCC